MTGVISATTNADAKQFDFLEGEWSAVCRFPLNDGSWGEGPGSLKASKVLDGCVFLEYFDGPHLGTIIKGLGLRAFNPQTSQWETTWTDTSAPGGFRVWRGRFEGGVIDLHGQWEDETGRKVLSRLTWSRITEGSAHWEGIHKARGRRERISKTGWRSAVSRNSGFRFYSGRAVLRFPGSSERELPKFQQRNTARVVLQLAA